MDKEKKIYYVMGHTIDPTLIPSSVEDEDAFVRPVDIDPAIENLQYEDLYNAYTYIENMKFEATSNSGGGGGGGTGGGVTIEQMNAAIQAALDSIEIVQVDNEGEDKQGSSYQLQIGGEQRGVAIDDKYLADVTTDKKNITFTMSNGETPFTVSLDELENDPILDMGVMD